ncbi:1-phosphofructokinase family hexose kinase [Alterinioella nitratireducens]|uniref:1-phosphofructokinase family hexose kinase n=1 Tax=Alterinioella nitratireducens TaxID=2735915 RepID=UPI001555FFD7|nr:hexose kinase [Alterinioella nitratireducens]NPD19282.1 hexose kinase [Alterinioella nitratireducens]
MREILTITLNPAVDLDSSAAEVEPGPKLRCDAPRMDPGGGGINISRALAELGGTSVALVAVGGAAGETLRGLLDREGVTARCVAAPGDTRQNLSVTDRSSGAQYRFVFPGPEWRQDDLARAQDEIAASLPSGGLAILSGSQPEGFPDDFAAWLVAIAEAQGAGVILDSSGPALAAIAQGRIQGLELLRLDHAEAEELAGRDLPDSAASADLAADLVARRVARMVVLARGAEGSVLVTGAGRWFCTAARVPVRSRTGAGDSFVAGFAVALARGDAPEIALQHGVAAASAAVMTEATALCRRSDAEALMDDCPVRAL